MIWSVAWRNIWRSKSRSLILIVATATGLFAGVFTMAFMQGAVDARIESATRSELAHLQIHDKRFPENNNTGFFISGTEDLMHRIQENDSVVAVCRRIIAEPFIMAAHGTGGGKMTGIEPENEQQVTDISQHLTEGTYLENRGRIPPILIGEKLAKKLRLKTGSRVNVQMINRNGYLSSKGYRISGIYKTSNTGFDEMNMFVHFDDLKTQLGMDDDTAHELALLLHNGTEAPLVKPSVQKIADNLLVQTWKEISPEMSLLTDSMDQYMYIFIMIILMALCFGIINTMLMAVLERTRETGMLMAVGMSKFRIFSMIILESLLLTLCGGILGMITGSLVTRYFETHPINLALFAEGLESYGYAAQVYTSLKSENLVMITLLVIITGIVSAIYPAIKALSMSPAEATRTI